MRRVINKQDYWDNWADLIDSTAFVVLDAAIAIGLLALMLIAVIPAALVCTLGYAPDEENE